MCPDTRFQRGPGTADRNNKRPFGAAPAGAPPSAPRAAHSKAERGAARRWLRLDRRRRMGEGSAAEVPWGDDLVRRASGMEECREDHWVYRYPASPWS